MIRIIMNIKKVVLLIGACAVAVSPIAVVMVGGNGCANKTPQTVAFQSYSGMRVGVQTLLAFWDTYLANAYSTTDTNKIAQVKAQEVVVKGVYQKWQASMALAADAGAVWSAAVQGTNSTVIASALGAFSQAVNNASATQTDLQNAIGTFTGKPLPQ